MIQNKSNFSVNIISHDNNIQYICDENSSENLLIKQKVTSLAKEIYQSFSEEEKKSISQIQFIPIDQDSLQIKFKKK